MLIAGGLLRARSHAQIGKNYLFDLKVGKDQTLVTDGPYGLVRHPMYLGLVFVDGGWVLMFAPTSGTWLATCAGAAYPGLVNLCWAIVTFFCMWQSIYVVSRASSEDAMLRGHFGKAWDRWAQVTKYRVIPGVY